MTANEGPRKINPTPDAFEPLHPLMELRCGACGQKGKYAVGRLFVDPNFISNQDLLSINKAFCFTGYFHCKHCGAGGPWDLTPQSQTMLLALLGEAIWSPKHARIHPLKIALFDGTPIRWPTQGEAHLKQLIETDPNNYFLWNRLGNIYKSGGASDLALEAFHKALERNEQDVESLHSIAEIHLERREAEEAARFFHQMLLHAKHAPVKTPRELLRSLVRHALETLADLHLKSDERIPFLPKPPSESLEALKSSSELVVQIEKYDLSSEKDWDRMVEQWMPPNAAPAFQPSPIPAPTREPSVFQPSPMPAPTLEPLSSVPSPPPRRVGRNDRCPCGSGKKFKVCCMRS